MAIYTKKFTPKQKQWAENYEKQTGYEPLYQEDFDARKITFEQFAQQNIRWFEDWSHETLRAIDVPVELCV